MSRPPQLPAEVPDYWGVYFAVADIEATVAKLKKLGGSVHVGPMAIEPGTFAMVADPQGAMFNVMQLSPERAAAGREHDQSVERTVRPARAPVCSPCSMNTAPLTMVAS